MRFTLIYDPEVKPTLEETILPLVADLVSDCILFSEENLNEAIAEIEKRHHNFNLLLYLSDNQIKKLLPILLNRQCKIAVLPHPECNRFAETVGVDTTFEKNIEHIKNKPDGFDIDILYSNGRPVLQSIVIGSAFQLATSNLKKKIGYLKRTRNFMKRFFRLRPFQLDITQKNESVLRTAVSGIVIVPHQTASMLSRFLPGGSVNDGMLHALLISPRSIFELFRFAIRSIWKKNELPDFGAHIRTERVKFAGVIDELRFTEDGNTHAEKEIEIEVKKKAITIIPGPGFRIPEISEKETWKIQALPKGEAAYELSLGKLPLMRRASSEEFKELFLVLRENASIKSQYLVLMVLSTALATLGLFGDSPPVVIGAMILAPLMAPIISLSMATLRQDKKLIIDSVYTILAGLGLAFGFAVLITWATPIHTANSEILARTRPNILDLGVAVISGIAGAYAHAREEVAKTLAGVAIAVALVPPLAVAGIGLGWLDWSIFFGATLLLITNLTGMVLAGSLTFMILGFSPFRLATRGVLISLLMVIIFSIPLGLSFNRMVFEHNVVLAIDGIRIENVLLKDVRVQSVNPLSLSILFVSDNPLDDEIISTIKQEVEDRLSENVDLEIRFAIQR